MAKCSTSAHTDTLQILQFKVGFTKYVHFRGYFPLHICGHNESTAISQSSFTFFVPTFTESAEFGLLWVNSNKSCLKTHYYCFELLLQTAVDAQLFFFCNKVGPGLWWGLHQIYSIWCTPDPRKSLQAFPSYYCLITDHIVHQLVLYHLTQSRYSNAVTLTLIT